MFLQSNRFISFPPFDGYGMRQASERENRRSVEKEKKRWRERERKTKVSVIFRWYGRKILADALNRIMYLWKCAMNKDIRNQMSHAQSVSALKTKSKFNFKFYISFLDNGNDDDVDDPFGILYYISKEISFIKIGFEDSFTRNLIKLSKQNDKILFGVVWQMLLYAQKFISRRILFHCSHIQKILWFRMKYSQWHFALPKWTHSYYKIFINNSKYIFLSLLDFIMNNLKKKNNKQQQKKEEKTYEHKNGYISTMCVNVFVSFVLLTSAFLYILVLWYCYAHHHHHHHRYLVFIQSTIFSLCSMSLLFYFTPRMDDTYEPWSCLIAIACETQIKTMSLSFNVDWWCGLGFGCHR